MHIFFLYLIFGSGHTFSGKREWYKILTHLLDGTKKMGRLMESWYTPDLISSVYLISSKFQDKLVYLEIYFCGHLALMYSGCVSNVFSIWLSALNFIHVLYSWLFLITKFHRMCYPTLRYHSLAMYDTYSSCSLLPNCSWALFFSEPFLLCSGMVFFSVFRIFAT